MFRKLLGLLLVLSIVGMLVVACGATEAPEPTLPPVEPEPTLRRLPTQSQHPRGRQ